MKGIGKILLWVFAALAIIGFLWVIFTPGAASAEVDKTAWMENPVTSFMILISVIAFVITLLVFLFYKVIDLIKHPSHLRETLYVLGAIALALVIGFVFAGGEEIANTTGATYEGMQSRMIGTGIVMSGVLLLVGLAFLVWDTVRGVLKG